MEPRNEHEFDVEKLNTPEESESILAVDPEEPIVEVPEDLQQVEERVEEAINEEPEVRVEEESQPEAPPVEEPEAAVEKPPYLYRGGSVYQGQREPAKKTPRGFSRLTLIAVALVFTLLGTSLGVYSAFNILPGTTFFQNSELGKLIAKSQAVEPVKITVPQLASEKLTIPEIVKAVQPAVVTVAVKAQVQGNFFNPGTQYAESIGTGFILNEEGLIATNYHVVESGGEITVIFYNGEEVPAKVLNYDQASDLAVIQLTKTVDIPGTVTLGDSDNLQVGESVIAIGNPLSKEFAGTVTSGIVSATDRTVSVDGAEYRYIQTDAAINGGNSGGPLINARGEVIGINSAKISDASVEGIGFAIPINVLKNDLTSLSKAQLYIGISGRSLNAAMSQQYDLPQGVLVVEVMKDSPAYVSALAVGDVITEFDGKAVASVEEINTIKNTKAAGDTVKLKVFRDGTPLELSLILVEKP